MNEIRLHEKVEKAVPSPERGQYAFVEALLPAILIFGTILALTYGSIWVVKWLGGTTAPVSATYAGTILVVAGLFLGSLIASANHRFDQDQTASGVINTAFRLIAHGAKSDRQVLDILTCLAWQLYYFFRAEEVSVISGKKKLGGAQPILAVLATHIDGAKLTAEMRLELLGQIREVQSALGGIARRRTYRILRSRYIVNGIFSGVGVFLMSLSATTGEGNPWIGQAVAFVFTYGLTTALQYVHHMEFGIGYDPGDVRPDLSLATWLQEIAAASE